ncbi:AAA family ATPase [Intestinibacter bartlettii]|uniref:nucleotide-binding protein n=1 Tax=Intestinibacter bartlettii TaxID=261299 RepID=UPI0039F56799
MIKIAVYGKGGIGKSTTISNLSVALANKGLKVMQIGCDPKADSTTNLHDGSEINTVLDLVRERKDDFKLDEMVIEGYKGILCVEAGGPTPGMGCAGRGIIAALEKLEQKGAYETYKPDIVFYDVLGDVVCGGFSMPMRAGYADKIFIITSGEYMAIHAAVNIATAIDNFKDRGYASLGGVILNKRNVKNEEEKVNEFIENIDSKLVGILDRDEIVVVAEEDKKTVLEAFPESLMAKEYEVLADNLLKACGYKVSEGNLEKLNNKKVKSDNKDESNDTKKEEAKC